MDSFTKKVLIALGIYAIFAVIILILFQTIFMFSLILSSNMEHTIAENSIVFSTRYDVKEDDIERFDILVFILPDDPDITYIKRVIDLPDESIEVSKGKVYADGVELDSSSISEAQNQGGDGIYKVPEGCYFFLGDNQNNSDNSRFWTKPYIFAKDIQAKAKFVIYPFSSMLFGLKNLRERSAV